MRRYLSGKWIPAMAGILALLAAWQLAVVLQHVPDYLVPAPTEVVQTLVSQRDLLWQNTIPTVEIAVIGLILAIAVGLLVAVLIYASPVLRQALYPLALGTQTVPLIALAPVLVIVLGYDVLPKLMMVCLVCFFPVIVNTVDGLSSVDRSLVNMMRALGASRWRVFRDVTWPNSLPYVFSGVRVAAAYSVVGALVGEWVGSFEGLGHLMTQKQAELDTPVVFAALVVLFVLGAGLFAAVGVVEYAALPWRRRARRPDPEPSRL